MRHKPDDDRLPTASAHSTPTDVAPMAPYFFNLALSGKTASTNWLRQLSCKAQLRDHLKIIAGTHGARPCRRRRCTSVQEPSGPAYCSVAATEHLRNRLLTLNGRCDKRTKDVTRICLPAPSCADEVHACRCCRVCACATASGCGAPNNVPNYLEQFHE